MILKRCVVKHLGQSHVVCNLLQNGSGGEQREIGREGGMKGEDKDSKFDKMKTIGESR